MIFIIKLVGLLIMGLGLAIFASPAFTQKIFAFFKEGKRIYIAGVVRTAVGLLFADAEELLDGGRGVRAVHPLRQCAEREGRGSRHGGHRLAGTEERFDVDAVVDGVLAGAVGGGDGGGHRVGSSRFGASVGDVLVDGSTMNEPGRWVLEAG